MLIFDRRFEIEDMVVGVMMNDEEWKDLTKLKQGINAGNGFTPECQSYNDFLKFIVEMEPHLRPKFIKWLTGSKRLPRGGFSSLANHVSVNRVADMSLKGISPDEKLPSVNTCLHFIKYPSYSSYEILKQKFEIAITTGADVFALN